MGQAKSYTIHFTYEIADDSIAFPLEADVTVRPDGTYRVHGIRYPGKQSDELIPSVSLIRQEGRWIYAANKKETALTVAIGRTIDAYERTAGD